MFWYLCTVLCSLRNGHSILASPCVFPAYPTYPPLLWAERMYITQQLTKHSENILPGM